MSRGASISRLSLGINQVMGHVVPDWHAEFDPMFKPVEVPMSMPMAKQGFTMGKELASSSLDPLSDFGDLGGWQENGGLMESTKGLWSEPMEGDGIAPVRDEFRMGALEGDNHVLAQHAAQQAKEAQDELESWLQYPGDESMDTEYCGEGFGNLPQQPVTMQAYKENFASGLTTTRFVRPNPFCPQPMQNGSHQNPSRSAASAAALADGAARVSGLLPNALPETLSRVRTQAQSTAWPTAPVSTGPLKSPSEKPVVAASQGGAPARQAAPPAGRQQVYPSIFDRSRLAAAATRVGAGTKLKAPKEPKRPAQLRVEPESKASPQDGVVKSTENAPGQEQSEGGAKETPVGEVSAPSPRSTVSGEKMRSSPRPQGSNSGGHCGVEVDKHSTPLQAFGADKTLEERQREFQAELANRQRQGETPTNLQRHHMMLDQHRLEMQRWDRGQISPAQLPPDRSMTGFKQIQPTQGNGGLETFPRYPPQAFMQQHVAAAEAMRAGRHSFGLEAGPSGQDGSLSTLTQEQTVGSLQGPTHASSVRAPAWQTLMQKGGARPAALAASKAGVRGKERSSQGNKASLAGGRDSAANNEITVSSSYSEGDSLATSRAYSKNPMIVGRKRDRCAKSDTEALDEENDTLTEGTWVTEETEGRGKGAGKDKGKRTRAAEVHNQSERRRRDRINDRMRALQELIPNSNKTDKASVLDEAIEYLKNLQTQLQFMSMRTGLFAAGLPPGPTPHGFALPPVHPPTGHLPPMAPHNFPSGMSPMHFLDRPPFANAPLAPPEEGCEMKPGGRPFGEPTNLDMYNTQVARNGGVFHPSLASRMELYEGQHPPQQPPPHFDSGHRQQ